MVRCVATIVAALMVVGLAGTGTPRAEDVDRVERAAQVLDRFLADPGNQGLRDAIKRARAVLVVPNYVRAGFVIGGSGGTGVMMARRADGGWNGPAFFDTVAGTLGPQLGVYKS